MTEQGDLFIKPADMPNQLAEDTVEKIRNSGAGFLADLVKQAERDGLTVDLTGAAARDSGAGFVQDVLRNVATPTDAGVVSISNEVEAVVTVDIAEFATAGQTVRFEGTGNATLDAPQAEYYVLSAAGSTLTINADLSAEAAPITQGRVFIV